MQMATQMQPLSSHLMMQSQTMFLQQQLLHVTTMNTHTHGLIHPPFNYGFNINQPHIFYQRPTHNLHVFYYRPVNTMTSQIFELYKAPVHAHPPTQSQAQQQPVFGYPPSHVQQHPNSSQKCLEGLRLASSVISTCPR